MENVEFIEIDSMGEVKEFAVIDRGNGEFTSMPRAAWDELQAQKELGETL